MKAHFKRPFALYVKKARKPLQLAVQDAVDAVCANPDIGEAKTGDLLFSNDQWRSLLFYDQGWVTLRQSVVAGTTTVNNYILNGAGFSVVWSPTPSTEMALMPTWKLRANPAADTTTGADSDGKTSKMRLWLFATQQF